MHGGKTTEKTPAGAEAASVLHPAGAPADTVGIQRLLGAIEYPVDRDALVMKALSDGAALGLVDVLRRLPDRWYTSPADVNRAIGDIE